jgi:phosphoribosyl 1,2-cyclic phosphodiesterase
MLNFICLGSGSSGNCYYLFTEDAGILLDAGVGVRLLSKRLADAGVTLKNMRAIFVTHDHADHIKALGALERDYNVPVYASQKVHTGIKKSYCVSRNLHPYNIKMIEKGETVQVGDFSVTAFDVPHDSSDNQGYMVEYGGITFCLITDAGSVVPDIQEAIRRANYLVIEANHDVDMLTNGNYPKYLQERILGANGHLSNATCADVLAENVTESLRHVWLCHLSEENNHPELARKTIDCKLRSCGIIPGKDFELDVLKRTVASDIYPLK